MRASTYFEMERSVGYLRVMEPERGSASRFDPILLRY